MDKLLYVLTLYSGTPIILYQPARVGYDRWKYTSLGKMGFDKIHGPVCIRNDFL